MRFFASDWFYLLPLLIVLVPLSLYAVSRAAADLERFISPNFAGRLYDKGLVVRRKRSLYITGLVMALLLVALARPQYGVKPVEVKRSGIDIMVLLDTSRSMLANDVKPDRISRAKNEIGKLVTALAGNRIGLVSFAGRSFVEAPLTLDESTVRLFLDTVRVGSIPVPGTDIGKAIDEAVRAFEKSHARSKVALLVTDGENLEQGLDDAIERARQANIALFPIGVGSRTGAPVPEVNEQGKVVGYKKDETGSTLISRLDIDSLEKIASGTGGRLFTSEGAVLDLDPLIALLQKMEKTDIASQEFTEYRERYQIICLLALLFLVIDGYVAERRRLFFVKG